MLTAEKFEEILGNFDDYDVVISFIGLPYDFKSMKYWTDEYDGKIPKFVLSNTSIYEYKPAILANHIVAVLHHKPKGYDYKAPIPDDPKEAFDSRFIIVTPENANELHKEFGTLFENSK